ncbi:MAG TPA: hypothetical protein VFR15_10700 [Chloroflexia bacterium]|nr:hypothetical protein [Chloroflexia bacterium]
MADRLAAVTEPDAVELTTIDARRPYAPSWLSRLMDWVERLPLPAWGFYTSLLVVLYALYTVVKWLDGIYPAGTFSLFHLVIVGLIVYAMAGSHYLSRFAGRVLDTFRPLLRDGGDYPRLRYQLTRSSWRASLLASLAGVAWAAFGLLFATPREYWTGREMFLPGYSAVLDTIFYLMLWGVVGAVLHQTVHQLRMVSHIYAEHTRFDLFRRGPLYEFSRLTARGGVLNMAGAYVWFAADPAGLPLNVPSIVVVLVFSGVALVAFVQPLRGLHDLLLREKQERLDQNGRQLDAITARLHEGVGKGDLDDMPKLESAISSLVAERGVLEKIRTWPWEPETARWVLTAVLLPLVLWFVQRLLERIAF